MDVFLIDGGKKLRGEVRISGNKNSALPIMISTLLYSGTSRISRVPNLADTRFLAELLSALGVRNCQLENNQFDINAGYITQAVADYERVRKMRASVLVLAPLLARKGYAHVSLPGGCAIGTRPVDIHLNALKSLGATIEVNQGYIDAKLKGSTFNGTFIKFPFPSVGATEQVIMAAICANGDTTIKGAAKEPEVVEFCQALSNAGAKINGAGTSTIEITGVTSLNAIEHEIEPDRIEAGTFIALAAACKSSITLNDVDLYSMKNILDAFSLAGCKFTHENESGKRSSLEVIPPEHLEPVNITTAPYPGFPTDLQAQFMSVMALAGGVSYISENLFDNRMMHVPELRRLGANIEMVDKGVAKITGKKELNGAKVMATDLRASASLIIAALAAKGKSEIRRVYHIDRGYEEIEKKLAGLGAEIFRSHQD